jgi:hypothetical protein
MRGPRVGRRNRFSLFNSGARQVRLLVGAEGQLRATVRSRLAVIICAGARSGVYHSSSDAPGRSVRSPKHFETLFRNFGEG